MQQRRPVMLVVLDGWGWREEAADNAVRQARTPTFDRLWASCPHALLRTSGEDVGLPAGQMGNSEVGHLNIGAGRIVKQTLQRITDATAVSLILILSDINMPGMSGLELLPKARAARPDVPIIMITAYGDAETKRKALEGGAEALFTKPIDFVALRSEIETRVERAA